MTRKEQTQETNSQSTLSSPGSWPLYYGPLNVIVVLLTIYLMSFYINMLQFSAFKMYSHIMAHTTNYSIWPADLKESMRLFAARGLFVLAALGIEGIGISAQLYGILATQMCLSPTVKKLSCNSL